MVARANHNVSLIESPPPDDFKVLEPRIARRFGGPEGEDKRSTLDPTRLLEGLPYGETAKRCAALGIMASLAARDYPPGSKAAEAYTAIAGVMRAFIEIGVRHEASPSSLNGRKSEANQLSFLNYLQEYWYRSGGHGNQQTLISLRKFLDAAREAAGKLQKQAPEAHLKVKTALHDLIDHPLTQLEHQFGTKAPFNAMGRALRDLKDFIRTSISK